MSSDSLQVMYGVEIPVLEDSRIVFPWTERNKESILAQLKLIWKADTKHVLEIASGSGQHVAHISPHFPSTVFQPTEYDIALFQSIATYSHSLDNVLTPLQLDASLDTSWAQFKEGSFDAVITVNLLHIVPWDTTTGLMRGVGKVLRVGGVLTIYGPFKKDDDFTSDSNREFDLDLKRRDSQWGLRDMRNVELEAQKNQLLLMSVHEMPAANVLLVFKKIHL